MRTYKWISSRGTVLGTLTVPDSFASKLDWCDPWETVAFTVNDPIRQLLDRPMDDTAVARFGMMPVDVAYCRLSMRDGSYGHSRDAVELVGVTPEQIEKLPGFRFAPSAAYIRSLLEGG